MPKSTDTDSDRFVTEISESESGLRFAHNFKICIAPVLHKIALRKIKKKKMQELFLGLIFFRYDVVLFTAKTFVDQFLLGRHMV